MWTYIYTYIQMQLYVFFAFITREENIHMHKEK